MEETTIQHPILGTIVKCPTCNDWEFQQPVHFPTLQHATRLITFDNDYLTQPPTAAQIQVLVNFIEAPASLREDIARAIFNAYVQEIRDDYLPEIEGEEDFDILVKDLPEITEPEQIWSLIKSIGYLDCDENNSINIGFNTTFDIEHHLIIDIHLETMTVEDFVHMG